jgi:hypothetical protein
MGTHGMRRVFYVMVYVIEEESYEEAEKEGKSSLE